MATNALVGSVNGLWRFPVKSMQGEQLVQAELTERGLLGDRVYGLIDVETGKVVSAKSVKLFPDMFSCRATFVEQPKPGGELPPVRIELPNGDAVITDCDRVDRVLSDSFGRSVRLARSAPVDFTIDQYHPHQDRTVEQKIGSALFAELDLPSPIPIGSFFDGFPVSILTTSTLERLTEIRPESRFDERRFRMNIIVATSEPGFVENGWSGHEVVVGDEVRLEVTLPDPRCVMTNLAQDDLPKDSEILRTLARHNRIEVPALGRLPCAGVYAVVRAPGTMRVGDHVVLN